VERRGPFALRREEHAQLSALTELHAGVVLLGHEGHLALAVAVEELE
jgi:hypothetical protein